MTRISAAVSLTGRYPPGASSPSTVKRRRRPVVAQESSRRRGGRGGGRRCARRYFSGFAATTQRGRSEVPARPRLFQIAEEALFGAEFMDHRVLVGDPRLEDHLVFPGRDV